MSDDWGPALVERLLHFAIAEVPGATGAGVTLAIDGQMSIYRSLGSAVELDRLQWELGEGPAPAVHELERTVLSDDLRVDQRYPRLALAINERYLPEPGPVHGVVAMPGTWDEGGPALLTMYLDRAPDEKTVAVLDRIEPVISHALATVIFCQQEAMRADQMANMVQYRRVIEQAKGTVMGVLGCSAGRAFEVLDRASQERNVKLREIAVALVEHVGKATAEHPDEIGRAVHPSERAQRVAVELWAALHRVR
jgi:hypothetical protein